MLELLDAWVERGWLRRIDRALVRWLKELEPSTPEPLLLAAALCSHQYGRGHICLDLSATLLDADATLSLPPEGDVGEAMPTKPSELLEGSQLESWLAAIKGSPLVNSEASPWYWWKTAFTCAATTALSKRWPAISVAALRPWK